MEDIIKEASILSKTIQADDVCSDIDEIYKNINSEDFFVNAKDDYLNPDIEDAVYLELETKNIYEIVTDKLLENVSGKAIVLAGGDGKITYMLSSLYNFETLIDMENIYELHYLAKKIIKQNISEEKDVRFLSKSLLDSKLIDKDLIVMGYNNVNKDFNNMLENKIINEAKSNSLIVKIALPFRQNVDLKLLDVKRLINFGNSLLVFYYKNS